MKSYLLKYGGCLMFCLMPFLTNAQFIRNTGIELTNSALLVSNGTWTNDAGTVITNNGTISTSESFTNNGTLAASTGGFELKFITDLEFKPGGADIGFLVKDGVGAALLTGTLRLGDSLVLKQGIINFAVASDTIVLLNNAIVNGSTSSFINGIVAHEGSGNLLFPIGKNSIYLPLTMHKVQASRVTASLMDAPVGITAGPGVDSLISFPYAWKVQEKLESDTAAYVEVSYPTSLPVVEDPIIVRQTGTEYTSMGARLIEDDGARVTVRSYSRALEGVFSVAKGFPVDPITDSLALVALYDATGGSAWTTQTNWTTGPIDSWFGVTRSGQTITSVALPANNLTGEVPDHFVDILGLQTIDLSGNNISAIPDFTANPEITSLDVSGNKLTFASLEPNAAVPGLHYIDQAKFTSAVDSLVAVGSHYVFSADAGGENTAYQWKRNGTDIEGATTSSYELTAINRGNMGEHLAVATNTLLPALTLESEIQNVLAYANISGTMYADTDVPATDANMTLFRVTATAYDTIAMKPVAADGTFTFEKVVLDDYQLLGFADTVTHEGSLPTYYKNTIYWEEADTLVVEDNIQDLGIVSQVEPGPPTGRGIISGFVEEDDGTGRTKETQKAKRVSGAGVTARRVENTGRGKEEVLTLVSYVFTNETGEFSLTNLPEGEYRLNIQYPGYPMDPNSYVTIPIGSDLESQVQVGAYVEGGQIVVRKFLITGIYEAVDYIADVYPNPAVNFINLKFGTESGFRNAVMLDTNGKTISRTPAASKEVSLNVQNLAKGIYLLNITEKGVTVKTVKVSIE
jgi:hypothetical protein